MKLLKKYWYIPAAIIIYCLLFCKKGTGSNLINENTSGLPHPDDPIDANLSSTDGIPTPSSSPRPTSGGITTSGGSRSIGLR